MPLFREHSVNPSDRIGTRLATVVEVLPHSPDFLRLDFGDPKFLRDCLMTTHFSKENERETVEISHSHAQNCAVSFFCAILLRAPLQERDIEKLVVTA